MPLPQTARLRFETLSVVDAPFILELVNEPGWLKHIGDRQIHSLDAAASYIRNGPMASYAQHGFGLDQVTRIDTGEAVGLCGLLQREYLDAPDIGYAFLQRHGGNGFATEAAHAVLAQAHQQLGLRRVYALTSLDNAASIRVLDHCGFVFHEVIQPTPTSPPSRLFSRRW